MERMTLLHDSCMLAVSPMQHHVWFAHHFNFIGNAILNDPEEMTYMALCSIGADAEVSHINIDSTLGTINADVPTMSELLLMDSPNTFRAALKPDETTQENVYLTGVLCLPPFLFADLAAIHRLDIYSYFAKRCRPPIAGSLLLMMRLMMPSLSDKMSSKKFFSGYGPRTEAIFFPQHLSSQHQAN